MPVKQRVGSYEIVRVLARGGMAVVYRARQPALDRDVALKRLDLQTGDPNVVQRFVREARLAAALHHPNIVTLFDFFEDGGVPYIAMEYVGGGSLRPLVGTLSVPQVFGVLEGVLAGLAHAESAGIAHRDLKPENVLITREGGVKIADFGIARAYGKLTQSLTGSGNAIGTPAYMAPEQAQGGPLTPRTDLYAVGVIAYELFSGRPPFDSETTPVAVLYAHVHTPPPPLRDVAPDVPPAIADWVERLLAKDPAERPQSASATWDALEEIAVAELGPYWRRAAAISATTIETPVPDDEEITLRAPPDRPGRRRRWALTAAAALAVALGAAAAIVWWPEAPDADRGDGAAAQTGAAVPYDFDGDGHQDLTIGSPGGGPGRSGAVIVRDGNRAQPSADAVITAADAGLPASDRNLGFGTSLASADFDRDGHADLAVSAPGSDVAAVLHGTEDGLRGAPVELIHASEIRMLAGAGRYGSRLLADDLDGDGYGDLVIGAPAADTGDGGSGAIQIVFGGPGKMNSHDTRAISRPVPGFDGFGTKLRTGDVDHDGHVDLVEGAPDGPEKGATGHMSLCRGTRDGPHDCEPVSGPGSSGTSALAVADVDGDGYEDAIQGDAAVEAPSPGQAVGGEVRIWRGGPRGLTREPVVVDQRAAGIPGRDEAGDAFGANVDAGDLDGDGFADIVVSVPGEDDAAGAVTVVRGRRDGYARTGNTRFREGAGLPGPETPGRTVGWSVGMLDLSGDGLLDVALSTREADDIQHSVYVIDGGKGAFAPGETHIWRPLRGEVPLPNPGIPRLRIARSESS